MAPSKDQDTILRQFREELVKEDLLHDGDSIGTDDHTLLRFLRARQYNVKQTKIMWKNCYEWRKTAEGVGIDELYRGIDPFDYPERDHVFKFWPLFFHKTDKRGRPINIHHFGRINTVELYKGVSPERFWQAFLVNAESLTREVLPAATCAAGKQIDGSLVIVDLKGFGTGQFWQMKNLAHGGFQISQDYFPETMSQLTIVNAPSSFTAIWAVMKPWLAKETVAKVSVLGSNYQSALLELVYPENLPTSLGGTCTCADCEMTGAKVEKEDMKDGAGEMGRCAFSSAGPWMMGRKERRETWLKGERSTIALLEGELEKFSRKEKGESTPKEPEQAEMENTKAGESAAPSQAEVPASGRDGSEAVTEREDADDSSDDSSPGPGTPGLDTILQQDDISIKDGDCKSVQSKRLSREDSVNLVAEKHSETRTAETDDLYAEA